MINRELIRLKIVQLVYAYHQNGGKDIVTAEKELLFSLSKAYELYEYLLSQLVEMRQMAERKYDVAKAKAARTGIALKGVTPDGQFAQNQFLLQLEANKVLQEYREKVKKEWIEEEPFLKKLYAKFTEDDIYQAYLDKEDFSYEADREVVRKLYKTLIDGNDDYADLIEEHSLYWNDDKEVVDSFVMKTIKRFTAASTPEQPLLPEYASEDDRNFALQLFRATLERGEELRGYVKANCKNWKFERLALMDIVIAQIALAEMLTCPTIPLNVTFNEYLDIAKIYSTPRSASYLNGLLEGVVKQLREQGVLLK